MSLDDFQNVRDKDRRRLEQQLRDELLQERARRVEETTKITSQGTRSRFRERLDRIGQRNNPEIVP